MSYILDALKKSEQARGHGAAPGIQTVHSSGLNYQAPRRSLWPWVLIAAVMLNLVVLLYFVFNKHTTAPAAKAAETTQQDKILWEPATPRQTTSPAAPVFARPELEPVPDETFAHSAAEVFQAVDIKQLPDDIRRHIPAMEFSGHVFSSNPKQRSVVINGRFMEEGASLSDDFVLKEITSTGVIMEFQGTLFRNNVISGW